MIHLIGLDKRSHSRFKDAQAFVQFIDAEASKWMQNIANVMDKKNKCKLQTYKERLALVEAVPTTFR